MTTPADRIASTYKMIHDSGATFDRIDSLTDTQRRDALIFLTGYVDYESVNKACDYVTRGLGSRHVN